MINCMSSWVETVLRIIRVYFEYTDRINAMTYEATADTAETYDKNVLY